MEVIEEEQARADEGVWQEGAQAEDTPAGGAEWYAARRGAGDGRGGARCPGVIGEAARGA